MSAEIGRIHRPIEGEPLIIHGEPLWVHTSMRVGGSARSFARPGNPAQLQHLLRWAEENGRETVVLGGGTNTLFRDAGFSGLVIHTSALRGWEIAEDSIRAGAGENLAQTAWRASRAGLTGLEWACGIPGTIGGAVAMNAGTREGETADVLRRVEICTRRTQSTVAAAALDLGYRTSALQSGELPAVVVEAEFRLQPAAPDACLERARSLLAARLDKLPRGASVGSVFRNPAEGPAAGELLDRAGCKGMHVGSARVSTLHANVIINDGKENAADVLALIERMKDKVRATFGVELHEEVVIVPVGT